MEMLKRVTDQPARKVESWGKIKSQSKEIIAFLDEKNGKFDGNWAGAYALHACQVGAYTSKQVDEPYNYFVVANNLVPITFKDKFRKFFNMDHTLFYFPHRVIINPEILETPTHFEKMMPKQDFAKNPDKSINIGYSQEMQKLGNEIDLKEACMTFPNRTKKYVRRYFRIKVRYQIPVLGFLVTRTHWIEGLKAHIYQHEFDHGQGKTIYYK